MKKYFSNKSKKSLNCIINNSKVKYGICVLDINGNIIYAYNENELFDTACSIMSFIMLEYFSQEAKGKISGKELLTYTEENYASGSGIIKYLTYGRKIRAKDLVELMIATSDHIAANMLIDFLKIENINSTIRNNGFIVTKLYHKFLIPKLKNMGITSPYELSLFYFKLINNKLINNEACNEMIRNLLLQKYKDILTDKIDKNDSCYINAACKSGKADGRIYDNSTDSYIVDAGIIYNNKEHYCISIMGEINYKSCASLNIAKDEMQTMSMIIYEEMKRNEDFIY